MGANYSEIQELLQQRADIQARLNLMPYDGNPEIKEAYKKVEIVANQKLLEMLPEDLRPDYEPFFDHSGEDPELLKLLKAADKISALIKCVEEENSGNREFSKAKTSIMESIEKMGIPEAKTFVEEFLPSYGLTIDELN